MGRNYIFSGHNMDNKNKLEELVSEYCKEKDETLKPSSFLNLTLLMAMISGVDFKQEILDFADYIRKNNNINE